MAGFALSTLTFLLLVGGCRSVHFSFTPRGADSPSIIMNADFTIEIKAFQGGKHVATFSDGSVHSDKINLFGYANMGGRSVLFLRFPENLSWDFIFNEETPDKVIMDSLVQFVPSEIFPPHVTQFTDVLTFDNPGMTEIKGVTKSYQCDHRVTTKYVPRNVDPSDTNFTVSVTLASFRIQAYNVKNGQFSPAVHCPGDSGHSTTTTTTTTTTTPRTTTSTTTTTTTPTTTTTTPTTTTTTPTTTTTTPTTTTTTPTTTTTTPTTTTTTPTTTTTTPTTTTTTPTTTTTTTTTTTPTTTTTTPTTTTTTPTTTTTTPTTTTTTPTTTTTTPTTTTTTPTTTTTTPTTTTTTPTTTTTTPTTTTTTTTTTTPTTTTTTPTTTTTTPTTTTTTPTTTTTTPTTTTTTPTTTTTTPTTTTTTPTTTTTTPTTTTTTPTTTTTTPTTTTTTPTTTTTTTTTTTPTTTTTTTTPTTTTTTTTTTTLPPIASNQYVVRDAKNNICATILGDLTLEIPYFSFSTSIKMKKAKIAIPESATASGDCSQWDQQILAINFLQGWQLSFVFKRRHGTDGQLQGEEERSYAIESVHLRYVINKKFFPHSMLRPGTEMTVEDEPGEKSQLPFKKPGDDFYQCPAKSFKMTTNTVVYIKGLKFKAFNTDPRPDFYGHPTRCGGELAEGSGGNFSDAMPASVGSVLGVALVVVLVIVVVFVIIKKRRNGYETLTSYT